MQARFENGAVVITTRSGVQSFWYGDPAELQLFRAQLDQATHQLVMHRRKHSGDWPEVTSVHA